MATLHSELQFTGPLGELTAYKMRGSDKIILRTKGGPSRKQIQTGPSFANTRRRNAEFGGRATASKWIIRAMGSLKFLADSTLSGRINALLQPIQELDTTSVWGRRSVQLSKNPQLLAGFSLKSNTSFDGVLRTPVTCTLARANRSAHVEIPALMPRLNFFPVNFPYYSIEVALGMAPDLYFNEQVNKYTPVSDYPGQVSAETPWCAVADRSEAISMELIIPHPAPDENYSILLSIGIKYGMIRNGKIEQVKNAGCGKVLALG